MEVDAILKLTIEFWDDKKVSIAQIVSDDDTTMRSNRKHLLKDKNWNKLMRKEPPTERGHKKECHGCLPIRVPEPSFLFDPTRHKKNVGKYFYALAALSKTKSPVTTKLASKMKCAYGCCMKITC